MIRRETLWVILTVVIVWAFWPEIVLWWHALTYDSGG